MAAVAAATESPQGHAALCRQSLKLYSAALLAFSLWLAQYKAVGSYTCQEGHEQAGTILTRSASLSPGGAELVVRAVWVRPRVEAGLAEGGAEGVVGRPVACAAVEGGAGARGVGAAGVLHPAAARIVVTWQ